MIKHNLFYYPYASFTNAQIPLLKVAALWFDKLVILDPVGASWDSIGVDHIARDALQELKDADILEIVTPANVLATYEQPIADAIRRDMSDQKFLDLCDAHGSSSGKQRWTLSLSKVPQDVQTDQKLRNLMGNFARDVAGKTAYAAEDYIEDVEAISSLPGSVLTIPHAMIERAKDYRGYTEMGRAYSEYREGYDAEVEYRYADFPLALGEAIMLNHALFAGLLHVGATPITDNPFHSQALAYKLNRAASEPAIHQAISDRVAQRQLKADVLAAAALMDSQIQLPILNTELPLAEVLEYRQAHDPDLQKARKKLGDMARRIEAEPWTADFARELEHKVIPDIALELDAARKSRDSWLKCKRGRLAINAAGLAAGTAVALLAVYTAPTTPVALATAGLGLVSGTVIPAAEWLYDWREGKNSVYENGLHYLLKT